MIVSFREGSMNTDSVEEGTYEGCDTGGRSRYQVKGSGKGQALIDGCPAGKTFLRVSD